MNYKFHIACWTAVCTRMCLGHLNLPVCELTPAQIHYSNKNKAIKLRMLIAHCSPLISLVYILHITHVSHVWYDNNHGIAYRVWRMTYKSMENESMAEKFNCTYYTLHSKLSEIHIFRISTCRMSNQRTIVSNVKQN